MNGASRAALQFAAEAASVLGTASAAQQQQWLDVAAKISIPFGNFSTPFGSYSQVHLMPANTVPFDTVLINGRHSVCPEDILYLSYPMGPALNIR
jgi:hypothetical protein